MKHQPSIKLPRTYQAPPMDSRTTSSPIVIIGAGVFGLSTAINLAERGYKDVTVIDKQDYGSSLYSYDDGCDAASADINKIIRCAYGTQKEYQDLSVEALEWWLRWNDELSKLDNLPAGLTKKDKVFTQNGNLQMTDKLELPPFESASVKSMKAAGLGDTQYVTNSLSDRARASKTGFSFGIDPFNRVDRGKPYLALFDSAGGLAHAERACRFALHKGRLLGVKYILGGTAGTFSDFKYSSASPDTVEGVLTKDGRCHPATMTIAACGGWTPTIVTELDGLCETTGGSVALLKIPKQSPLFTRFLPKNFPTWTYKMRDGSAGGLYGFPVTEDGWMKIGYRGTKYTNPQVQADGKERSVPITRWSVPEQQKYVPRHALNVIKDCIHEFLPEVVDAGINIERTRLCWYNDTFDNHFIVDRVPGKRGLMVASGGSGHAFMFFPNIGKWVVDVLENVDCERVLIKKWSWRVQKNGEIPVNILMEGSSGSRALCNVEMCDEGDLILSPKSDYTRSKL